MTETRLVSHALATRNMRIHPIAAGHLRAHLQILPIRVTQQIPRNRAARTRLTGPHDAAGPTDMELP